MKINKHKWVHVNIYVGSSNSLRSFLSDWADKLSCLVIPTSMEKPHIIIGETSGYLLSYFESSISFILYFIHGSFLYIFVLQVTSKPDLYPLVISYNAEPVTKSNNGSTGYLMVQYFRNFIVRPVGKYLPLYFIICARYFVFS